MRKIIFLLLIVFWAVSLNAQKFGVKGGMDLSKVNTDLSGTYTNVTGINGSVFFQKSLIPMLSLRPAVGYFQKGYYSNDGGKDHFFVLNYGQLDLNLRVKPPLIPIYVVAGPYFSYALSGIDRVNDTTSVIQFGSNTYSPFDFGVTAGLGFVKKFAVAHFFFEINYNKGILDYYHYSDNKYMKNSNISVDLGFMIGL